VDPNLVLWILQVLLALAFLGAGVGHILNYDRMATQPRMSWVTAVGRDRLRIIGVLEVLGAIGVVLPAATGVLPWLVPVAAASLALLMAFAVVFHARRHGEMPNLVFNLVLGVLALVVAIGRSAVDPF
jgi:putative oxidoreductase